MKLRKKIWEIKKISKLKLNEQAPKFHQEIVSWGIKNFLTSQLHTGSTTSHPSSFLKLASNPTTKSSNLPIYITTWKLQNPAGIVQRIINIMPDLKATEISYPQRIKLRSFFLELALVAVPIRNLSILRQLLVLTGRVQDLTLPRNQNLA